MFSGSVMRTSAIFFRVSRTVRLRSDCARPFVSTSTRTWATGAQYTHARHPSTQSFLNEPIYLTRCRAHCFTLLTLHLRTHRCKSHHGTSERIRATSDPSHTVSSICYISFPTFPSFLSFSVDSHQYLTCVSRSQRLQCMRTLPRFAEF